MPVGALRGRIVSECNEMAPRESVALPLPHLALTISAPSNGLEAFP